MYQLQVPIVRELGWLQQMVLTNWYSTRDYKIALECLPVQISSYAVAQISIKLPFCFYRYSRIAQYHAIVESSPKVRQATGSERIFPTVGSLV